MVVTFQPCLHTNQVMFIDKEDDVLGPVNLTWWEPGQTLKLAVLQEFKWHKRNHSGCALTPEVLGQAKKQTNCLVVLITWAAGGAQHQGLCPWSSWCPKDAIHISAFHHLREEKIKYYPIELWKIEPGASKNMFSLFTTHISFFVFIREGQRAREPLSEYLQPTVLHGFY